MSAPSIEECIGWVRREMTYESEPPEILRILRAVKAAREQSAMLVPLSEWKTCDGCEGGGTP